MAIATPRSPESVSMRMCRWARFIIISSSKEDLLVNTMRYLLEVMHKRVIEGTSQDAAPRAKLWAVIESVLGDEQSEDKITVVGCPFGCRRNMMRSCAVSAICTTAACIRISALICGRFFRKSARRISMSGPVPVPLC